MAPDSLLTPEALGDVLVNLVPLAVLAGFVTMFVVASPYATDPVYTTVQLSLVVIPAVVLLAFTYYALQAVDAAERATDADVELSPGYTAADAETARSAGDDY